MEHKEESLEERLQRAVSTRKAKLAKLTGKMNQIRQGMDEGGDSSLTAVQSKMTEFNRLFGEFCNLNTSVKEIYYHLSEEDMIKDQTNWLEPKADSFKEFAEKAESLIKEAQLRIEEATECNEAVQPSDSISSGSFPSVKQRSKASSVHSSRASSSASSTRLKTELERAALIDKASTLKKRQSLEEQEAKLKREKEELEIQTALAASDAKIKILDEFEGLRVSSRASSHDGKSSYVNVQHSSLVDRRTMQGRNIQPKHQLPAAATGQTQAQVPETLQGVTEMLTKQQRLATLPRQSIPVFKGDPLEYLLFKRAFEHGVENKTDSNTDRLYFFEQYTAGQPRELIRSCLHWNLSVATMKLKDFSKSTSEMPTRFQ